MAMLTIAGTNYDVLIGGAEEREPYKVGSLERMFSGRLRSSLQTEKREWRLAVGPLTAAQFNTLRAATMNGAQVAVSGDILGAAFTCVVVISGTEYDPDGTGLVKVTTLEVLEV